jgi:uncharacterized protein YjiS (DUF1127 family)
MLVIDIREGGARRKQMSIHFRSSPHTFVEHGAHELANTFRIDHAAKRNNNNLVGCRNSPASLRNDHVVLLAIDALVALRAWFKKWRDHRRTLRALADLDEHQLRDIGITREGAPGGQEIYRSLAGEVLWHSPRAGKPKVGPSQTPDRCKAFHRNSADGWEK